LGYGFLWNLPAFGHVEICDEGSEWHAKAVRGVDYWVTTAREDEAGGIWRGLLERFTLVSGRVQPLPWFATGFWQCNNRYRTPQEVVSVASEHKRRGHPLSVIVIDYHHWKHFGDWSFDPGCWGNTSSVAAMVSTLQHELGARVMVSVWPFIEAASIHATDWIHNGHVVTDLAGHPKQFGPERWLCDALNPEAQRALWRILQQNYVSLGIDLFWLDADEPERSFPDDAGDTVYNRNTVQDLEVGMAYPLGSQRMLRDGLRSIGAPPVFLSRSAWIGTQATGAVIWSGDTDSTFEELAVEVRAGLSAGMSGLAHWTTDIGGFRGGDPRTAYFQELVVRWFQFGTWLPITRLHGLRWPAHDDVCGTSGASNEIWTFGEAAYRYIAPLLDLREALRPYISGLSVESSLSGAPLMRPLFFQFPYDTTCSDVEDQFMLGHHVLVAPVVEYEARSRTVCLPMTQGASWLHLFSGELYSGGRILQLAAPLEEPLVLVLHPHGKEHNDAEMGEGATETDTDRVMTIRFQRAIAVISQLSNATLR